MSADEIFQEQQKLASQLDPNLLQFIRSRRQGKQPSVMIAGTAKQPSDISELTSETFGCMTMGAFVPSGLSLTGDADITSSQHNIDTVTTSQSWDRVQIPSAFVVTSKSDKHGQSTRVENEGTSCQSDFEMSSVVGDLAMELNEANKWLHMDVVEHEKLQWIGDIPLAPPAPPDTTYSARFDFQGRKILIKLLN